MLLLFLRQLYCNADCAFQIRVPMCKRASNVYSGVCSTEQETFGINLALVSFSGMPLAC